MITKIYINKVRKKLEENNLFEEIISIMNNAGAIPIKIKFILLKIISNLLSLGTNTFLVFILLHLMNQ